MKRRAFTLVELLVSLVIIAALAGMSMPVYERVVQSGRAAGCISNLRALGAALNLYTADHNLTLPNLQAGRSSLNDNVPVIDNTLNVYAGGKSAVFGCPADNAHLFQNTGTSYYWNVALNGQSLADLHFLALSTEASHIPLLADKQAFHPYTQNKVNILYADGHGTQDVTFMTGDNP
jgi:prepilin-type N-terminal cleavage/methylation domain-containing protein/prepilin-type processing-associated H-X9-DG protein